jgi:riboflavin biosynthesis pyrimidine reductase
MDFDAFATRKTREATEADLSPLVTEEDRSSELSLTAIGNDWTRRLYDGEFHVSVGEDVWLPPSGGSSRSSRSSVSLVFVQSRDGNTETDNPEELGGGPIDKHFIYEGLSRVAADGVLAGAKTAGPNVFFSVWHPQLVALRETLGLPRHPAQLLLSGSACLPVDDLLSCNVPSVPAFILTSPAGCERLRDAVAKRTWMTLVVADTLAEHLRILREDHGIGRISCVGGRTTATSLIDEGLVDDLYLTTTEKSAGKPGTPFYTGAQMPRTATVVRKRGSDPQFPILFEHLKFGEV